ncbi:Aste57867_24654 [Aphanomyces stellatus]|uniref:Aste57867_24654 protein n=1 Tax=Aphanomyces stellatus TaxID=120398 RepID=A0A485LSI5_9STRA|nr:hypothetical protein As57867_024576 [Aphanomyces stellatus]VFU01291.1 Aste57867_24654 [Aphanomyces stellatus]
MAVTETMSPKLLQFDLSSKPTVAGITAPTAQSTWMRGQSASVHWDVWAIGAEKVKIYLMQKSSRAYTKMEDCTDNTGCFDYRKVPWGLVMNSDYFIRIVAHDDDLHFIDSDCFEISV